jgi:hypothetical protein
VQALHRGAALVGGVTCLALGVYGAREGSRMGFRMLERYLGRAVQVEPMKPTLKAPGTKRLKLNHYRLLSSFGFKINLRRYTWVSRLWCARRRVTHTGSGPPARRPCRRRSRQTAGTYTRPLCSST